MFIVLSSSPNRDGLTAACTSAAVSGIRSAGGNALHMDLCEQRIESCLCCDNGWGICLKEHRCIIEDRLADLQQAIAEAKALFLVTPVYWGQPSERMQYFLDRFRRCEAFRKEDSALFGKRVNLVAAAGGSGNGTVSCLEEMERWCRHVGAVPFERVGVTRFNREGMLQVIETAGADLVKSQR